MVCLGEIDWLKGCNKCRPHNDPIYWLFRWLLRLSLAAVPGHRWKVSARYVYQSLLKCGMTLPHQSCKRFDSARVLPQWTAVRVICSGSLQAYGGSAVRYSRRRVSNVFPLSCSSFNRCAVYGGGRLRVSFGATRESEWGGSWPNSVANHHYRSIDLARQRRARLYAPRRCFISKAVGKKSRYHCRYHTYVRVYPRCEADRYSVQNRWFLV